MKRYRFFTFMAFSILVIAFIIALIGWINAAAREYQSTVYDLYSGGLSETTYTTASVGTILDVPFIGQTERYPTGCESTTAVMALQYNGIGISVDDFIDRFLDLGTAPYEYDGVLYGDSPWNCFLGSPYSESGWGCYSPVIHSALEKVLENSSYSAKEIRNESLGELCSKYIDNGIPVIIWATMEMKNAFYTSTWQTPEGEQITWIAPEHCLLLVGYDKDYYYFNDSQKGKQTAYPKHEVETAYESMLSQAVVITPIK